MTARETTVPIINMEYYEAGIQAARNAMQNIGLPNAYSWMRAYAPDLTNVEAVSESGRPGEFWAGMLNELRTVSGTA
jgi:hypothetical protein